MKRKQILLLLLLLCLRKRRRRTPAKPPKPVVAARSAPAEAGMSSSKDDITGGSAEAERERNKLVFFDDGIYGYDFEDLLRASAEVLGKGSVGISYKAMLEEGITVVVKRLKDVVVTKKEFEMQMEILGKIKHDNLVPSFLSF